MIRSRALWQVALMVPSVVACGGEDRDKRVSASTSGAGTSSTGAGGAGASAATGTLTSASTAGETTATGSTGAAGAAGAVGATGDPEGSEYWSCGTAAGVCTCTLVSSSVSSVECAVSDCCFVDAAGDCSCRVLDSAPACDELTQAFASVQAVSACPPPE